MFFFLYDFWCLFGTSWWGASVSKEGRDVLMLLKLKMAKFEVMCRFASCFPYWSNLLRSCCFFEDVKVCCPLTPQHWGKFPGHFLWLSMGLKLILAWSETTQYIYIYTIYIFFVCIWLKHRLICPKNAERNSLQLRLSDPRRTRSPSMFPSTRKQWNRLPLQCQLPSRWSQQWGRRTCRARDDGKHVGWIVFGWCWNPLNQAKLQ